MQDINLYDGDWHQIGGDVNAAEYSGVFAKFEDGVFPAIRVAEIIYLPAYCGSDAEGKPNPYVATEAYYEVGDLTDKDAERAIECVGLPPVAWDAMTLAEALFSYKGGAPVGHGDGKFNSFIEAMRDLDIPQEALLKPDCYTYWADESRGVLLHQTEDGSYEDEHGNHYYRYNTGGSLDSLEDAPCDGKGCKNVLDQRAWVCLDGGDTYCDDCVTVR